jgi:hypothetical protein
MKGNKSRKMKPINGPPAENDSRQQQSERQLLSMAKFRLALLYTHPK